MPMKTMGACMADRAELVEAALEVYREGLALLDEEERVVFWNRAAETITGYPVARVLGRQVPAPLEALAQCPVGEPDARFAFLGPVVHAQHLRGHDLPLATRRIVLRDGLGERIGSAAVFHCAEQSAALSQPEEDDDGVESAQGQADLRERLEQEYERWRDGGEPLAILWIKADQGAQLRKTHGVRAWEAMLDALERTLANALLSGEELGNWSGDEFLLVTWPGLGDVLAKRAQALAGLARTTDFRWWGDRISITVSIGAAAVEDGEPLPELLKRTRQAMEDSVYSGGNHVTVATGRQA
jgi:GGDEF domain-containing protein